MSKGKADTLTDQLRRAIRADGRTVYRLAKDCGVSAPIVRRFLAGQRDITLRTADRICRTIGVALRATK